MTASYPTSVKSFTTKTNYVTTINADHINDAQLEIAAIETAVGTSPTTIDDTVAATASPASVAEALDMLANRIKAITGESNWYGSPDSTIAALAVYITKPTWTAASFQNSWVNYENGYNPGGYTKDGFSIVHLRGLVRSGTVGSDAAIFTLPAGYRPAYRCLFDTVGNGAIARVDVLTSGVVTCVSGNNAWLSLDHIQFLAEA